MSLIASSFLSTCSTAFFFVIIFGFGSLLSILCCKNKKKKSKRESKVCKAKSKKESKNSKNKKHRQHHRQTPIKPKIQLNKPPPKEKENQQQQKCPNCKITINPKKLLGEDNQIKEKEKNKKEEVEEGDVKKQEEKVCNYYSLMSLDDLGLDEEFLEKQRKEMEMKKKQKLKEKEENKKYSLAFLEKIQENNNGENSSSSTSKIKKKEEELEEGEVEDDIKLTQESESDNNGKEEQYTLDVLEDIEGVDDGKKEKREKNGEVVGDKSGKDDIYENLANIKLSKEYKENKGL
uniref:Candidate secreted effector n=1 Tax=Meloidogyne incognita TaxID=6306 RepID=A0A914KVK0_MELIC